MATNITQRFEQDFLNCPICVERCTDQRMLPCAHSFCMKCLYSCESKIKDNNLNCPICRETVYLPNGVRGLPRNFYIVNFMEMLNLKDGTSKKNVGPPACGEHPQEKLDFYCKDCGILVCRDCVILLNHEGHTRVRAEEGATIVKNRLRNVLKDGEAQRLRTQQDRMKLRSDTKEIHTNAARCISEIESHYSAFVAKLASDKEELLKKVKTLETEQCSPLKLKLAKISSWLKSAEDNETLTRQTIDGNQWEMIRMEKRLTDSFEELKINNKPCFHSSDSNSTFKLLLTELHDQKQCNRLTQSSDRTKMVTTPRDGNSWLRRIGKLNLLGEVTPAEHTQLAGIFPMSPPSQYSFSFKSGSGSPSTSPAFGASPTHSVAKSTTACAFGSSSKSDGASGSSLDDGHKIPVFSFGTPISKEKPSEPEVSVTTGVPTTTTSALRFTMPVANSTFTEAAQGKAVVSSAANQQASQRLSFGSGVKQFPFGSQSAPKPSSRFHFGSPGTAPKDEPTFGGASSKGESATPFQRFSFTPLQKTEELGIGSCNNQSSQFSFRLDVSSTVLKSADDRHSAKCPGLNKSGENWKSPEHGVLRFKPIVTLPENAVLETGEENEDVKFTHGAKLYRFDAAETQWKERGVGDIKVLYNPQTKRHRIVMRRERVLKVCANHFITKHVDLKPNAGSPRSWVWQAMDVSDGEVQNEQLAVRFKTEKAANEFKEAVDAAKSTSG